jgi:Pyruvate/2-oxoacid:ferredoxin oxidoreductase delta subunit
MKALHDCALPAAPATSRAKRERLVAIVSEDCTGCLSCVDFCLVDCIEPTPAAASAQPPAPVHVREDECIGCSVCAKVCEEVEANAIHLVPADRLGPDQGAAPRSAEPPSRNLPPLV